MQGDDLCSMSMKIGSECLEFVERNLVWLSCCVKLMSEIKVACVFSCGEKKKLGSII